MVVEKKGKESKRKDENEEVEELGVEKDEEKGKRNVKNEEGEEMKK